MEDWGANVRYTKMRTSYLTGFYAIARAFLKLAVAMKMGEPYLTWELLEQARDKNGERKMMEEDS